LLIRQDTWRHAWLDSAPPLDLVTVRKNSGWPASPASTPPCNKNRPAWRARSI